MTQKTASKPPLATAGSTETLRLLRSPADISKSNVKEAQLQKILDGLISLRLYLVTEQFVEDVDFKKNLTSLLSRLRDLQTDADKGWVKSNVESRAEMYSEIKLRAQDCTNRLTRILVPAPQEEVVGPREPPKTVAEAGPQPKKAAGLQDTIEPEQTYPQRIMKTQRMVGTTFAQAPWTVEVESLPARTAGFIFKGNEDRARELIGDLLSPYLNYRHATTEAERSRYAKQIAKAASKLIDFIGGQYEPADRESALSRAICGRGSPAECSRSLAAMRDGDVATIERLLQEGNSPLAEFMEETLNTVEGEYRISIPYLVLDPSVRAMIGEHSYVEARLLVVGLKNITETRTPTPGTGEVGSEYSSEREFRLNPELSLGAEIPLAGERISFGMKGGVGAYNPYYLRKNQYVFGVRGNLSLSGQGNFTDFTSVQLNLEVDGKHGMGKKAFTELMERAELVFMTFMFGNRVGLGVVTRADAVQILADSFVVPLHGITWDAGLANQLILSSRKRGTVNIYFAGGYTEKYDKLQGVGTWDRAKGVWVQINTLKKGVGGGFGVRFYWPTDVSGLPKEQVPFNVGVGGNIRFDF